VRNSSNGCAVVSRPITINLGTLLMSTTHVTIITVGTGQIVSMARIICPHIVATVTFSNSEDL
jgi:hypothetical protein